MERADTIKDKLAAFFTALALLAVPMLLMFHRSLEPNQVLFSNDGPLGILMAQFEYAREAFVGYWEPLNWIGIQQPSALPHITSGLFFLWGNAVTFAKWYPPVAMIYLGLGTFVCMRQFGFRNAVCLIAALAMELHMNTFSHACWGLPSRALTLGSAFFAVAALQSGGLRKPWLKAILAGWAVAIGIMEGFDVGAIFSLYVAAFAFFVWAVKPGPSGPKTLKGILNVAVVAIVSAIFAAQALTTLINTQVKGVVGMGQDDKSKEQRWTEATMWSLPKAESLRLIIPGLFGYRMDAGGGGNYWGSVGQSPGNPATRHSGAGEYAGVMVILVCAWAIAQSFSKKANVFTPFEKKLIWFWGIAAFISLLFSWGRHAPFYKIIYSLPYFSTIRNPMKFMHPFQVATGIIFACGLEGICRRYLTDAASKAASFGEAWKTWWRNKRDFDRSWAFGSLAALGVALLGWLIYTSSGKELEQHLATAGFPGQAGADIARFSQGEVAMFVVYLAVAVIVLLAICTGWFAGPRNKWAFMLVGGLVVLDLMHANQPWVVYYNYKEKYANNSVLDFLQKESYNHRVATELLPFTRQYMAAPQERIFPALMNEWLQHHFQFFRIQSPDIIQFPRVPVLDDEYRRAIRSPGQFWLLSNTRYVLAQNEFVQVFNDQLDPVKKRFQVLTNFDYALKPTADTNRLQIEDFTAEFTPQGRFAIVEYTGALPRAALYSSWQVETNSQRVLEQLANPAFDGTNTVFIADPIPASTNVTTQNPGTVTITKYQPRHVFLSAQVEAPAVLLLNDRWDPSWKVVVDGKEAPLLRANHIMRGVRLEPGNHQVEFHFQPTNKGLQISLGAILLGICVAGYLGVTAGTARGISQPSASPAETKGPQK